MSKITFDQLPEMVAAILEKLESLEQSIKNTSPIFQTENEFEEPITIDEVSKIYHVSRQTVYSWIRENKIHQGFMKKGRRFWYRSQLKEFDLQNK